jgi:hypothetical protein
MTLNACQRRPDKGPIQSARTPLQALRIRGFERERQLNAALRLGSGIAL